MKLKYKAVFDTNYRELATGDTIKIKSKKDDQTVITINKGRKEYLLPTELIDALKLIQDDIDKKDLFIDGDGYDKIYWDGVNRKFYTETQILEQLTDLGIRLYKLNEYGRQVVDTFDRFF